MQSPEPVIRDKIWYEMTNVRMGECYLALYLNHCKTVKKQFKGLTILFSTSGVFGWTFWEYYAALVCGIIAIIQLLTLLTDQLVTSDDDLIKIAKLRSYYTKYMIKLEELWLNFDNDSISEQEATRQFFDLKGDLGQKIEDLDNKLHIKNAPKLASQAERDANKYLTNNYHG